MLIKCEPISDLMKKKYDELFPVNDGYIISRPGNKIFVQPIEKVANDLKTFHVKKDDFWVVSYPRTGSTWAQEMVWLLRNNLDYEGAKKMQIQRSPLLEACALYKDEPLSYLNKSLYFLNDQPSPRSVKTHLPWEYLPDEIHVVKPKIIYTARNIKDTTVSFFHYLKSVHQMKDDFEQYCDLILNDEFLYGCPIDHMLRFWENRHQSNILFLKYEDMKRNLTTTVQKCIEFLEIDRQITEVDLARLVDHLDFEKMQNNPAINLKPIRPELKNFIRKGETGDWKNYMSDEISQKFDAFYRRKTYGTGLEFDFE